MNDYIKKVKEFHEMFGQEINDHKNQISIKTRKLRIGILYEELHELAQASGTESTFLNLCSNSLKNSGSDIEDTDIVDKIGELDALSDLQYVLSGSVLSLGYHNLADYAFDEVHRSNMSKKCSTLDQVRRTMEHYNQQGQPSYYKEAGENSWIVYRLSDNKVLKNIDYSPANLGIIHRFYSLMEIWRDETKYCSGDITDNWAHNEIVSLGKEVLPIIFNHVNEHIWNDENWISWAPTIIMIIGDDVIDLPKNTGNGGLLNEICLLWGKENGYCDSIVLNKLKYIELSTQDK